MSSRRAFIGGGLAVAGLGACGPIRTLALYAGMGGGTLDLKAATTLPFVLSGNHIYIRASVGGRTFAFIFDTGGAAIVTPEVQGAMKFAVLGHVQVGGVGSGSESSALVNVPLARVGDATYRDGAFIVLPMPPGIASPIPGLTLGGIVGREFFTKLVTTIDYQASTLTFTPPALFRPDPQVPSIPMSLKNGYAPSVAASVNGTVGTFDIDAGSGAGITLTAPFAKMAGVERDATRSFEAILGYGAGGALEGTVLRAKSFVLGASTIVDPVVAIARASGGAFANPDLGGNIGGDVLRRFTVTLDVANGKLYLAPNAHLHDRLIANRAGIFSKPTVEETVVRLVPKGPGEEAGVRVGDVLAEVDGERPSHDRCTKAWLQPVGTKVALTLLRDGKRVDATVVLRDLV